MVTPSLLRFGRELEKLQLSDIEALIQAKIDESQNLEYKEPSNDLEKDCNNIAEGISGFLNTDGGILIYGVSEIKEGDHRYPTDTKWCSATKERLEGLLVSRIYPWEEQIKIKRIQSEENKQNGIFVIEVPKSSNPPHMYDYRYYQRLNFRTLPMTHQSVLRAFQTSWIRRRDLQTNVIEPLYSEIKTNCEKIKKYERGVDTEYQDSLVGTRYLYDQIEPSLQKKIEEFYERMNGLNRFFDWAADKIATMIINEELCRHHIQEELVEWVTRHMGTVNLDANVFVKDASGITKEVRDTLNGALLQKTTVLSYLQTKYHYETVVEFKPVIRTSGGYYDLDKSEFAELWKDCVSSAEKNETYRFIWDEIPKLLSLGEEILSLFLTK